MPCTVLFFPLRRVGCAALLSTLLVACASNVHRSPPPIAPPLAAQQARVTIVSQQTALNAEKPAPAAWWELFNDATLTALEAEVEHSFELRAALARIEESRALLGLSSANRRPQFDGEAGYSRAALSEYAGLSLLGAPSHASNNHALGLQLTWELDLWGHLRQLENAARANLEASWYEREAMRVSITAELARTYLLLRGTQAQIQLGQENRRIAEELVRMADSRERNGIASRYDAASARADLAGVEASLLKWQQQRDGLMNALALLLGRAPRELNERLGVAGLPPMPARLPIGLPSELARQRPDIRQAQARLQAAVADIGAAEADFYPRIRLGAGLGVQAIRLDDLGNWGARQYSVGPTLHLPIFDGARLSSQLALSEARHQSAAIAYQQVVLRAWHEVDNALSLYASEQARHQQLHTAEQQSREALTVARDAYREGSGAFTSLLLAQRSLLNSQSALADCATASALSVVGLYRALGGGWSSVLLPAAAVAEAS